MTRINTIDVTTLTDQHLMAEYRELPMVHASLRRSKASKKGLVLDNIPAKYTLNKGHVTFFYNKGKWLHQRWHQLIDELKARGYDIKPDERVVDWNVFDAVLYKDWSPVSRDHGINLERILYRINEKREFYKYRGKPITDAYFDIITEKYYV